MDTDSLTVVVGGCSDGDGGVTDTFLAYTKSMNNEDRLYVVNQEGFIEEMGVWLVEA